MKFGAPHIRVCNLNTQNATFQLSDEFQHCKYYGFDDTRNNMAVVVSDFWTPAEQQVNVAVVFLRKGKLP